MILHRSGDMPAAADRAAGPVATRWPIRRVTGAQLRQVPPGPDERFLHDVVGAGPVGTEPFDVPAQGQGIMGIQLADRSVGVADRFTAGRV